ncbi:MAG: IMP dehydrogenase [Actinomycetota bacterium]|nr:IMP dehydrogenase [Actinomycetota bacterium]
MALDNIRTGLTFDDVLLVPRRSSIRSRQDVSLRTQLTRNLALDVPIVAANMDTVCEADMAIAMATEGGIGMIHRFLPIEHEAEMVRLVRKHDRDAVVGAAVGTDGDALERGRALVEAGVDAIVLDIAHGHADHALETLQMLARELGRDVDLIAGNVATRAGAEDLIRAGADAVKVGVGPGGVCTTRLVAGVGVPQLTAINDCAGVDAPIIADGGIRTSGDIAKALAAGADTVMIGSMFAGTKESPGEFEHTARGLVKTVRGMASFEALAARAQRHGENVDAEYFEQRAPEGVVSTVAYKGEVGKVIRKLLAGVKSAMSYCDARTIAEFSANAEFIRVTPAGLTENHPHAMFPTAG